MECFEGVLLGLISQSPSSLIDAPLLIALFSEIDELLRLCRRVRGCARSPVTEPWFSMLAFFAACLQFSMTIARLVYMHVCMHVSHATHSPTNLYKASKEYTRFLLFVVF